MQLAGASRHCCLLVLLAGVIRSRSFLQNPLQCVQGNHQAQAFYSIFNRGRKHFPATGQGPTPDCNQRQAAKAGSKDLFTLSAASSFFGAGLADRRRLSTFFVTERGLEVWEAEEGLAVLGVS